MGPRADTCTYKLTRVDTTCCQCTAKLLERSGKAACREFAPVMLPNKTVAACMSCHVEFG